MWESLINGLNEYRAGIHLLLHVVVPFVVAWAISPLIVGFSVRVIFAVLMLTMLVDADHLVADPIYAPGRCSIWFHPLHTFWPIVFYGLMTAWPLLLKVMAKPLSKHHLIVGLLGLGLLIHMALDWSDCIWMK